MVTAVRNGDPLVVTLAELIADLENTTPEKLSILVGNHIPVDAAEKLAASESINELNFEVADYSVRVKPETVTVQTVAQVPE